MNCPKCNAPLASTEIRGMVVDRCPNCRGVWFDEHELESLLELSPSDLRPIRGGSLHEAANRQRAKCPRDQSDMTRVCSAMKHEIVLDSCPKCRGIWLDGGELDRLLRA